MQEIHKWIPEAAWLQRPEDNYISDIRVYTQGFFAIERIQEFEQFV